MLSAYITDLLGNHLARVGAIPASDGGNQTKAKAELNGARTGSVRISAADRTGIEAVQARPGSRMLKVYYRPPTVEEAVLVVWGVIGRPVARLGGRVLEVTCVDATARAKAAFAAVFGRPGGDDGVTIDGLGVETVWDLQVVVAGGVGAPTPGVVAKGGRHGALHAGKKVAISEGQDFQGFIDTLSDEIDGPDWELRPLDTTHGEAPEGLTAGEWADLKASSPASAFYTQLHTYDRKGNDLRETIAFSFGLGVDNLEDLEIEVAGEQTANVSTVNISAGEKEAAINGQAIDFASLVEIGIYARQTSLAVDASVGNRYELAQGTAEAQVDAYKYAPVFLTLTVKKDELARFYPFHNFDLGDLVKVGGESGAILIPYQGTWVKEVPARVTEIELTEDAQGRVKQGITCVVDVGTDEDEE